MIEPESLERYRKTVHGQVFSPDGCSREEARRIFGHIAERFKISTDVLLDELVDPRWAGTPAHPACTRTVGDTSEQSVRYQLWACGYRNSKPVDYLMRQQPSEPDLVFAKRFWGWVDPSNFDELVARERERRNVQTRPRKAVAT
jgi:hypothetical protein